ncbi:MAG TPA: glycosyltransferase family 4 protein [Anaerolineales bacterium]|jgi:glycosyltransferase involved in cell wall biosynthesis
MNIAMVVSATFPPREGMGFYIWNLSRYLTRQGHQVQIITRRAPGQIFRESMEGIVIWRPFFAALYPFHVHLHSIFVSKLIHRIGTNIDIFHNHSPLVPPIQTTRPVALTFHSTTREDIKTTKLDSFYTLLMKLQAPVSFWLEVENLKLATTVSAVSPRVAEALKKYPHSPHLIPIVWNGVDTEIFYPGQKNTNKNGFILSVGRLGPGKGLEDLIDSMPSISAMNKDIKLIITGDGPVRAALEQRVKAYHLNDRVHFEGHVSDRDRLVDLYQKASLFVLPSHHEGLPTVILEAMACGCPVIATNVGGVPNVIEDGKNGIIIPPGDPNHLAGAVQALLGDPEKLTEMGMQARLSVEERFSWNQTGSRFVELYSGML